MNERFNPEIHGSQVFSTLFPGADREEALYRVVSEAGAFAAISTTFGGTSFSALVFSKLSEFTGHLSDLKPLMTLENYAASLETALKVSSRGDTFHQFMPSHFFGAGDQGMFQVLVAASILFDDASMRFGFTKQNTLFASRVTVMSSFEDRLEASMEIAGRTVLSGSFAMATKIRATLKDFIAIDAELDRLLAVRAQCVVTLDKEIAEGKHPGVEPRGISNDQLGVGQMNPFRHHTENRSAMFNERESGSPISVKELHGQIREGYGALRLEPKKSSVTKKPRVTKAKPKSSK